MSFFESHFLWLDVVIAASLSAAAAAAVGCHAVLRRVVFLPAALSQLSGLGVVVAFFLAHLFPSWHGTVLEAPWGVAVAFASAGALLLGLVPERRDATREWTLGGVYLGSSALVVLLGNSIPQEIHDVGDVLFGNAIAIERSQMLITAGLAGGVLLVHALLARQFVASAFDPHTAEAHGAPVRLLDGLLFVSMGLAAATSTRVVGALPAFAFAVFPSMAALRLTPDARPAVAAAAVLGAVSAFLGYWASFTLSLPTGACMAAAAAAVFAVVRTFAAVRTLASRA